MLLIALSPLPLPAQDALPRAAGADESALLLHLPERQLPGLQAWVDAAAEAAPRVIESRLQKLIAEANEEETRSLTRPRADVVGDFSFRENSETQDGGFKPYYSISGEQPLWHWNALTKQKRVAEIQKKLAENDYAEARRTLVLEIRRGYLDLLVQKLNLAETIAAYERQTAALKISRERAARGEYTADLLAAAQLDVRRAELARDRRQA
ncbi:MAG TPA: TolC family protein, partial [Rariglobus sp.]